MCSTSRPRTGPWRSKSSSDDAAATAELLPGTSADVEVVLEVRDGVLRVPTSALLEGDRVLVLEEGELEERSVNLGLRNWRYAELQGGLSEGEAVVVSLDRVGVEAGERAIIDTEDAGTGS